MCPNSPIVNDNKLLQDNLMPHALQVVLKEENPNPHIHQTLTINQ